MTYSPTDPKLAWLRTLFTLRLTVRRLVAAQDEMHRLSRALERKAKLLEAESPLNGHVVKGIHDVAKTVHAEFDAMYPAKPKDYGRMLMDMAIYIDHVTTLEDRCEALNVNVADRAELTEEDGIIEIIFAHGLEDSATYRRSDNNWDKPLFRALAPAFIDFMRNTPEGRAAADAALEDVFGIVTPLPGELPIDTVVPSIHDLHGQRSVECKPTLH